MSTRYYFNDGNTTLIPVADGEYFTDDMSSIYSIGACAVEFLDADGDTIVTPTGGTVTFASSPTGGTQWHGPSTGSATVDATTAGAESSYTMPSFNGPVTKSRMTLSGITGASFVRAFHWRDE